MKSLREQLADHEHARWCSYCEYMASELKMLRFLIKSDQKDEALDLIEKRLKKWRDRMTNYDMLAETNKEKDREWADKVLKIIEGCK